MPTCSKVFKQRDLFGELGWIPNFEHKKSKNNENRHVLTREFFDQPLEYQTESEPHSSVKVPVEIYRTFD